MHNRQARRYRTQQGCCDREVDAKATEKMAITFPAALHHADPPGWAIRRSDLYIADKRAPPTHVLKKNLARGESRVEILFQNVR